MKMNNQNNQGMWYILLISPSEDRSKEISEFKANPGNIVWPFIKE